MPRFHAGLTELMPLFEVVNGKIAIAYVWWPKRDPSFVVPTLTLSRLRDPRPRSDRESSYECRVQP